MFKIGVFLFNYFIVFLTMIVLFKTYYQLAKIVEIKSVKFLLILLVSTFLEIIIANFAPIYINGAICLSFFIIIEKIFTKGRLSEIIFYNVIIWLILLLLDMLIMLSCNLINLFIPLIDSLIIKPIGTIIMDIFLVWITKFEIVKKSIYKIKNYVFSLNISMVNFILLFILYFGLDILIFVKFVDRGIIEAIIILTLLSLLFLIKLVFSRIDVYNLKKTNQFLLKNNEFYIKLIDNYRMFKHNLTSQLIGIKSISDKKTKKLISDLIKEYNESFQSTFDIKDAPIGINGLIYEKIYNFNNKDLKISISNKISDDILNVISYRSYNLLCEALGIVLDNSLEAASKSNDKVLYLRFIENEKNIMVLVMNTFEGDVEIENIGKLNYTTKEQGHGLGLYSLFQRRKLNLKTYIKNNIFISEIKVSKK